MKIVEIVENFIKIMPNIVSKNYQKNMKILRNFVILETMLKIGKHLQKFSKNF